MRYIFWLLITALFFGCKPKQCIYYFKSEGILNERYISEQQLFNDDNLKDAWLNNDEKFIKAFFLTFYEDSNFDYKMYQFTNLTQFYYGNYDPCDEFWQDLTVKKRRVYLSNIRSVYLIYMNSCLFMNKELIRDDLWDLQYKHDQTELFTDDVLKEIKTIIESKCK